MKKICLMYEDSSNYGGIFRVLVEETNLRSLTRNSIDIDNRAVRFDGICHARYFKDYVSRWNSRVMIEFRAEDGDSYKDWLPLLYGR